MTKRLSKQGQLYWALLHVTLKLLSNSTFPKVLRFHLETSMRWDSNPEQKAPADGTGAQASLIHLESPTERRSRGAGGKGEKGTWVPASLCFSSIGWRHPSRLPDQLVGGRKAGCEVWWPP